MSSHTGHSIHILPPTFNNLDRHQRMRLVRSTRKLGEVLGTTPYLLEPLSPTSPVITADISRSVKAQRRRGRIFDHSAASSVSSLDLSDFDFASVSSSPSVSPVSSRASSFDYERSPFKPSPSTVSLGLHESPGPKKTPKSQKSPARPLMLRLRSVPLPHSDARVTPPSPDPEMTLHSIHSLPLSPLSPTFADSQTSLDLRRKKMAKVARTFGENVPPELVFPSHTVNSKPSGHKFKSASTAVVDLPKHTHERKRRGQSMASNSCTPPEPRYAVHNHMLGRTVGAGPCDYESNLSYLDWGKRKEKQWSGEWNVRDMEEVQKALRALKAA